MSNDPKDVNNLSPQMLEQRAFETKQLAESTASPEALQTMRVLSHGYAALAKWRERRKQKT